MLKTALLFIVLIVVGIIDYRALADYNTSFVSACLILLFPLLLFSLVVSIIQLTRMVKKEALVNVQAVVTSVFIALIIFEGILRVSKTEATYREKIGESKYRSSYWHDKEDAFWHLYQPNDTLQNFRGDYTYRRITNSLGVSEREINLKDTTTKKILCLGDSFTEGLGTGEDSTWPRILEKAINLCTQDTYLVYNAGIAGCDPIYNYHLLHGKLWDIKWDEVIFCINATDIPEVAIRGGMERFKANNTVSFTSPPVWEPLYASLHLVRFFMQDVLGYSGVLRSKSEDRKLNAEASLKIKNVLLNAHEELAKRGIKMMVVIHPMTYDIFRRGYGKEGTGGLIKEIATLKPLNLLPYFLDSVGLNKKNYSFYYWPNDGHFNTLGYNIMGHKIADELISRKDVVCQSKGSNY